MQFTTIFVAIAAFMAINASAHQYHHEDDCFAVDANSEFARTSGILNNLAAKGLLNDNSQRSSNYLVCN